MTNDIIDSCSCWPPPLGCGTATMAKLTPFKGRGILGNHSAGGQCYGWYLASTLRCGRQSWAEWLMVHVLFAGVGSPLVHRAMTSAVDSSVGAC